MGEESGKVEVKDYLMSEEDRKQTRVLRYLLEEGETEADQEGDNQEVDKGEVESCNRNCYVTVMIFSCCMIFLWFY